jgi:DNA-binding protein HU-beta
VNKADFVKSIAEKTESTQKDAGKALEAVIETIKDTLSKGEKIQIIGFGSFEVRDRKERKVISPATKKEILVPASKVPAFKAGKALKEAVDAKSKKAKAPEPAKKKKK